MPLRMASLGHSPDGTFRVYFAQWPAVRGRPWKYSEAKREEFRRLHAAGVTYRVMAVTLAVPQSTLEDWAQNMGLAPRKQVPTEDIDEA